MIHYQIDAGNPGNQLLKILGVFKGCAAGKHIIYIPYWRPGRYQNAKYAQKIIGLRFFDANKNAIDAIRYSENEWKLNLLSDGEIYCEYSFLADMLDAGSTYTNDELVYINFVNLLLVLNGSENKDWKIEINSPSELKVQYPAIKGNKIQKANYFKLIDEPYIACQNAQWQGFEWKGTSHNLVIIGGRNFDYSAYQKQFIAFTEKQGELFGEFPFSQYTYILFLLSQAPYHGVEHQECTIITLPWHAESDQQKTWNDFLGVASHELFHTWNVCRIKPKEMVPLNLRQPQPYYTGYITEGITTYYGDLMLLRSDAIDTKTYLILLNQQLYKHFYNTGRLFSSLLDSSENLWSDAYTPASLDRRTSIYTHGCILAFLLDLSLINKSGRKYSLDHIVKILWEKFGDEKKGYSHSDIMKLVLKFGDDVLANEFENWLINIHPLESSLEKIVEDFGLKVEMIFPDDLLQLYLGLNVTSDQPYVLQKIHHQSSLKKFLRQGDIIENLRSVRKDLLSKNKAEVLIKINRDGEIISFKSAPNKKGFYGYPRLSQIENPSTKQAENFKYWAKRKA
jgi:predicted metalloprotease with PDZ domain